MGDAQGKQGVRTLDYGDVVAGVINSDDITRIDPATEGGNLADVASRVGAVTTPAAGSTNDLLTKIKAAVGGGDTDIADYKVNTINAADGATDYVYTCLADSKLLSVVCAATVYVTFKVSIDPTGSSGYDIHWVAITSEASPMIAVPCASFAVASGGKIKVTKQSYNPGVIKYDVHSTFNIQQ